MWWVPAADRTNMYFARKGLRPFLTYPISGRSLQDGAIHLKHEGQTASELTNLTGRPIRWEPHIGDYTKTACVLPGQTMRLI